MINENFINFDFEPNYMNHDDTYPHEHHHTPAKLASHEYIECMHKKKNENECKAKSLEIYQQHVLAEQKYINCMNAAKGKADERLCDITFNKDNKYSYSNSLKSYEIASLQYCLNDELNKNIEKICRKCDDNFENSESSIVQESIYNSCIKNKEKCEKKYDNAKECINNLKNGETEECLKDVKYNALYSLCYEHKGFDLVKFLISILEYLTFPISKGPFFFVYFMFTVMSAIFFGGIFFSFIWMIIVFMYTILGTEAKRTFPGMIIYGFINQYFQRLHPWVLTISATLWAYLFGICMILYFFKKTFGWWPASWVWKSIGIFPGNEKPVFNWFDRLFGCSKKSGRKGLYCHGNNLWILMEDWLVEFSKKVLHSKKTELEIRNAINAFRDLGDDDIKLQYSISKITEEAKKKGNNKVSENIEKLNDNNEEFTNYVGTIPMKKKKLIEEHFIVNGIDFDISEFDKLTAQFKSFNTTIQDSKNEYYKNEDKNKEDMGKEEEGMVDRKYKECISSAETETDKKECEKNKCNSKAKTKIDEKVCEKKYN